MSLESASPVTLPNGHWLGYRRDAASKHGLLALSHTILGVAPTFPRTFSAERFEGTILDQNDTSSCTGHGTSQALQVAAAVAGVALFRPSPRSIYANARTVEEKALTDDGAEPIDVVATIASRGIRPLVLPSPQGFASDCDPTNVNALPTAAELAQERQHLEPGAYRIAVASTFGDQLCAAISTHGSAGIGIFVDSAFEDWQPSSGPVDAIDLKDPNGGGHWLALTSYDTRADGSRVYRGPNSWGPSWGGAGHFEITEGALLVACSDCHGFAVQAAAAPSTTLLARVLAALRSVL